MSAVQRNINTLVSALRATVLEGFLFDEMREVAHGQLRGQRPTHNLQHFLSTEAREQRIKGVVLQNTETTIEDQAGRNLPHNDIDFGVRPVSFTAPVCNAIDPALVSKEAPIETQPVHAVQGHANKRGMPSRSFIHALHIAVIVVWENQFLPIVVVWESQLLPHRWIGL